MSAKIARRGPAEIGMALIASALVCAAAGWLHMQALARAYGVICGADAGALAHCPACSASLLLFAAGVVALTQARAAPARARAMARPRA